jgi:hypothetical protein
VREADNATDVSGGADGTDGARSAAARDRISLAVTIIKAMND